jgi:hypothetical protein
MIATWRQRKRYLSIYWKVYRDTFWLICCCHTIMNTELKLEAPWNEVKEKLKEINTDLTDGDLAYQPGETQSFLEKLAKKMNRTPDETRGWVESVSSNKGKAS